MALEHFRPATAFLLLGVLLTACGAAVDEAATDSGPPDPTIGVELPEDYRLAVPRDAIVPIRNPSFVPAEEAPWDAERWVIGVEIDDEARAYPVGLLAVREMVVDHHRGIPTLVTW